MLFRSLTGEPVEDQRGRTSSGAAAPVLFADKEFRHVKIRQRTAARGDTRAGYQRKTHRIRSAQNDERMRMFIGEPIGKDLVLLRIAWIEHHINAGIQIGQRFEVFAVYVLDPVAVFLRVFAVPNADQHKDTRFSSATKRTAPESAIGVRPPGSVGFVA